MQEVKGQYGRVKGAEWFPLLFKKDIMVLGQGGIGSWVSLLLSRIGCNLYIYDMDTYEEHNMTGQVVGKSGIGKKKTIAMKELIAELSPDCEVNCEEKYVEESPTNDIVICGFDNMEARKTAFGNWKRYVEETRICGEGGEKLCFFQDGRLLAEQMQIFNIPGDRSDLIEKYEKEYLFDDAEVQEAECTFKQTSHCAAIIAGKMVGYLTNWIANIHTTPAFRVVPFDYEYIIPLNLVS
jgi:ThiF family